MTYCSLDAVKLAVEKRAWSDSCHIYRENFHREAAKGDQGELTKSQSSGPEMGFWDWWERGERGHVTDSSIQQDQPLQNRVEGEDGKIGAPENPGRRGEEEEEVEEEEVAS